jgi:FKBP-type peptidyl-prolyl cis-trans isomerase FklB
MQYLMTTVLGASLCASAWAADTQVELNTDDISYSLGYQIGEDLKRQRLELDAQALIRGIADAESGSGPLIDPEEMGAILGGLKRKLVEAQREQARQRLQKELDEGKAFLAENARKEGVISRPSGLQYRILREGAGESPGPGDSVTVNYRGTLINGNPFYDTADDGEPSTFRLDEVIPGWQEALPLMKVGAKWQLFVPPDQGFGERTPLRDRVLIFDLELVGVAEAGQAATAELESSEGGVKPGADRVGTQGARP